MSLAASIVTAQTRTLGSHVLRAPRAPSRRASKTDRCKDEVQEEECRARRRIERLSSSPVGVVRLTREHDDVVSAWRLTDVMTQGKRVNSVLDGI